MGIGKSTETRKSSRGEKVFGDEKKSGFGEAKDRSVSPMSSGNDQVDMAFASTHGFPHPPQTIGCQPLLARGAMSLGPSSGATVTRPQGPKRTEGGVSTMVDMGLFSSHRCAVGALKLQRSLLCSSTRAFRQIGNHPISPRVAALGPPHPLYCRHRAT